MNMEVIASDRHLRDLRQLYDNTESHVRSLNSLGIEAASYGALLSPVLLAKLPPELRLIVSRKVSASNQDTPLTYPTKSRKSALYPVLWFSRHKRHPSVFLL